MRAPMVVLILGCGGGGSLVVPQSVVDDGVRDDGVAALVAANGNAKALVKQFSAPLGFGGMWFPDASCRAMFGVAGTIDVANLGAFATCVAMVQLAPSPRAGALPNVGVVTYGPQLELEVLFERDGGESRVKWIGYVSQQRPDDALPTVLDTALARTDAVGMEPALRDALERDLAVRPKLKGEVAWLKLCVDESGAVTSVRARMATSLPARDAFVADAKRWRFRPYVLGDAPAAVCSLLFVEHPAGAYQNMTLPHPVPPSYADVTFVSESGLPTRLSGNDPPAERLFALTYERGVKGFDLSYLFCIDTSGAPVEVKILRSSGIPQIDQSFLSQITSSTYESPPEKVCTLRRHVQIFNP